MYPLIQLENKLDLYAKSFFGPESTSTSSPKEVGTHAAFLPWIESSLYVQCNFALLLLATSPSGMKPPKIPQKAKSTNPILHEIRVLLAPHTSGPRDVPRCGALSLHQKPLHYIGDPAGTAATLNVKGLTSTGGILPPSRQILYLHGN